MRNPSGPAVLVTGGAGYIGSHTCMQLAREGFVPVTLDDLSYGHEWAVQWGPLIKGDIADAALVADTIRRFNIEAVVHFAAYAYVGESMSNPGKYFDNNVVKTLALLRVLERVGVDKLVFSSTCATYGIPEQVPICESHPQSPVNPYGESKLFVERALHWYGEAHGLKSMALRYFNAAGADAGQRIGEAHDPETHLIPLVIEAALGQRDQVDIFGTDYPTPDGTAIRDYIHVTDLADAHVAALGSLLNGAESAVINLGTGHGYSVRQVIETVADVSGRTVPVRETARRAGDPPELVANPARARELLGWQARQSALRHICETAWAWHDGRRTSETQEVSGQTVRTA